MYNYDCPEFNLLKNWYWKPDFLIRITKILTIVFIQMTWCFQVWTLIREYPFKFIFKSEAGKARVV